MSRGLPWRQRREMVESASTTGGIPASSRQFSSSLSTFSRLQAATASGTRLIWFWFRLISTALITWMPSGMVTILLADRSTKSACVNWQIHSGTVVNWFCESTTVRSDFKLTKLSGRVARELCDRLNVSSFLRLPSSSGKTAEQREKEKEKSACVLYVCVRVWWRWKKAEERKEKNRKIRKKNKGKKSKIDFV